MTNANAEERALRARATALAGVPRLVLQMARAEERLQFTQEDMELAEEILCQAAEDYQTNILHTVSREIPNATGWDWMPVRIWLMAVGPYETDGDDDGFRRMTTLPDLYIIN